MQPVSSPAVPGPSMPRLFRPTFSQCQGIFGLYLCQGLFGFSASARAFLAYACARAFSAYACARAFSARACARAFSAFSASARAFSAYACARAFWPVPGPFWPIPVPGHFQPISGPAAWLWCSIVCLVRLFIMFTITLWMLRLAFFWAFFFICFY